MNLPSRADGADEWPALEPFEASELPEFPVEVLPLALQRWVTATAHATQTPPAVAAMMALAVCASCIARCVTVRAWEGWIEPTNIYTCVMLTPGNRKSHVFAVATAPLREIESEEIEAAKPEVARGQSERRRKETALQRAEKEAAGGGDNARAAAHMADELAAELATEPQPVLPLRIVDDVTPEQLIVTLAEQGGRIGCFSAEGAILEIVSGAYSQRGPSRLSDILSAHAGDPIRVSRIGRPPLSIERPALTVAITIQPDAVARLSHRATMASRGLLARFLWVQPDDLMGQRQPRTNPVPPAVADEYAKLVRRLASIEGEHQLCLTTAAEDNHERWMTEIEEALAEGGEMAAIRDWGAKLGGATLRLAGILHCIEHGPEGTIQPATIEAAIRIARHLIPHAQTVLTAAGATSDPVADNALFLLRWIEQHHLPGFSERDAHQRSPRSRFEDRTALTAALGELVCRGYIRQVPMPQHEVGRTPSQLYEVRPDWNCRPIFNPQNHQNPKPRGHFEDLADLADRGPTPTAPGAPSAADSEVTEWRA